MTLMTRLLARYLSVSIVKYYAALALVAVVTASLIEFLENRDGLMDVPGLTAFDALWFSLLSAPAIFSLVAGFVAIVAVLVACVALLRHSELTVMLAAGLTYGQVLTGVLPAAVLMAGLHFMMENVVLPTATAALHDWNIAGAGRQTGEPDAIWIRQGDYILSVGEIDNADETLRDVRLFALAPGGHMLWYASGPRARFAQGTLVFPEASRGVAGAPRAAIVRNLRIETALDFSLLSALALKPRQTSLWNIGRVLDQTAAGSHPRYVYELWFHKKLAAPILTALAVLLLAPLVQHAHRIGAVTLLAIGVSAGFLCLVADAVMAGMGEAGLLSPVVAAWGMDAAFALTIVATPFAWSGSRA